MFAKRQTQHTYLWFLHNLLLQWVGLCLSESHTYSYDLFKNSAAAGLLKKNHTTLVFFCGVSLSSLDFLNICIDYKILL